MFEVVVVASPLVRELRQAYNQIERDSCKKYIGGKRRLNVDKVRS